jgi:hypothetical protein
MSMGCVSGVASLSSFQILMVLSASPVIRRLPVASNTAAKMPASASRLPGWGLLALLWKACPVP